MQKDLISRQMAINTIMGQPPEPHYPAWYAVQIEGLPPAQPEPPWVPCSERMPEEGQKCLVYDKAVGFRVDTYIGHGNPFNWELFVRDYEAWMPLPEPYRGGEQDDR